MQTYPLDCNWFPDNTVCPRNHHDHTPKKTTRVSPFNNVFSSSKYNFLFKRIVNYIKCGFVNPATPPKSTPSSYTPPLSLHHHPPHPFTANGTQQNNPFHHWDTVAGHIECKPSEFLVEISYFLRDCFSASSSKANTPIAFPPQDRLEGAHSHSFTLGVKRYSLQRLTGWIWP